MSLKRIHTIIFIIVILIACFPLMKPGFFSSHDGELHLGRIPAFSREISDFQIPVRWTSSLNYGYGTPIFIIMYPLPYYVAAIPYLVGFGAIGSLKIVISISILLSAIFMWIFAYSWLKNSPASLTTALVYALLPYKLFNIYVRSALGEIVIMIFPPLILLAGLLISRAKLVRGGLLLAFSTTGLILSHNSAALMFVPTLFILSLILFRGLMRNLKFFTTYLGGWILGLSMSATYWLPAIIEKKYTMIDRFLAQKAFDENFLHPLQLIFIQDQELPIKMGVVSTVVTLYALYRIRKTSRRIEIIALLTATLVSIFLTLPWSHMIWKTIPLLPYFQLPWRFLNISIVSISLLITILAQRSKRTYFFCAVIIIIALIDVGQYLFSTQVQFRDNAEFKFYPGDTAWHQEGIPLWTAGSATSHPEKKIELTTEGSFTISDFSSTKINVDVYLPSGGEVIFNQVYFPGWKAYIGSEEIPIEFQDINYRGLMKVSIPEGQHSLQYQFTATKVRQAADLVSLIGFIATIPYFFWLRSKNDFNSDSYTP